MSNPIVDIVTGAVEGLGKAVAIATAAFKADPTKVVEFDTAIEQAHLQFQSSVIASINQTMQSESKSEHWMQWAWRPLFGITGSALLINNYILLPYLVQFGAIAIAVPMEVWMMIMAVMGVAAWTRGNVQAIEATKKPQE
jgi:hypothetical protein